MKIIKLQISLFVYCYALLCVCSNATAQINMATTNESGWKEIGQDQRISRVMLEPIQYTAGPRIDPNVHAYFTFEMLPGDELAFLNARLTDPFTGISLWLVDNVPLPPFNEAQIISYKINIEAFGEDVSFLSCSYHIGSTWQMNADFPASGSIDLFPQPCQYAVFSGSDEASASVDFQPAVSVLPGTPKASSYLYRGCDVPNEDLDSTSRYPDDNPIPNDKNACGPAAAANSLHWLVRQHEELAGEKSSLRAKLDSLKIYMNLAKKDTNGVRFDSMVVGKLTLIDKLKLPIRVKYKTKHVSGNVTDPLASTEPPEHTADNHGSLGVYPDFEWLKKEMDDGEDVEAQVGWYGPPGDDGVRERHGGHWVVVTGYFANGMVKGIYIKDDNDQIKAGGEREEYLKWSPGNTAYIEGMTDGQGNIAILESVVSESYDPTVTFDDNASVSALPWSKISLTGMLMKPGSPFVVHHTPGIPWIPILGGVISGGALVYVIVNDDKTTEACDVTATAQVQSATCDQMNGNITISVVPEGNYLFSWSTGATSNVIQHIYAGNYMVTITQVTTSCMQVLNVVVPNENIDFNPTVNVQDADCGKSNGTATIAVNPAGDYLYTWSDGSTGQTQMNLSPGSYTVTVSAGGTCNEVVDFAIDGLAPTFELSVSTEPSACDQSSGSATVVASPSGEYTYSWSGGGNGSHVTGLSPGEHKVTVTIAGTSCTKEATAIVGELPPDFEVTVDATPSACGMSNGTATVMVTPEGAYQYNWSNEGTSPTQSDLSPGAYTVTVSTAETCFKTADVTITELPADFTVGVSSTPSACGQATGTAVLNVMPPGNFLYQWSNGLTEMQVTGLSAGTFHVTVTMEGTTCSKETSVIIEELPASFILQTSSTPSGCTDATGTATVSVDPEGDYTFLWSNGMANAHIEGIPSATYTVTVTLAGTSCSMEAMVTVGQSKINFTGTVSAENASCGLTNGSATITIAPDGTYTYLWSDQQTVPTAQQLGPGDYTVTVTDTNGCSSSFSITIAEEEASHMMITGSSPGNCIDGGEILFTLFTSGPGPLSLQVTGPAGSIELLLPQGNYALSALMPVPAGFYTMAAYDQTIGGTCIQMIDITLADNTPIIQVVDDVYAINAGETVNANALQNDVGLNLMMTMIENETGGNVTFDSDGNFVFIPDAGFVGDASFTYIVTDACGTTAEGMVLIEIVEGNCEFSIESTLISASCGLDDGSISVEVVEEGMYAYLWDIGETGPVITDLLSGPYTVTIEDLKLGCSLVFSFNLPELPPDYISDLEVTQPTCETQGEISFVLSSPDMNSMDMTVIHPNGNNTFSVDEGLVILSDYISIVEGLYTIEVTPEDAGPECISSFDVIMNPAPQLEIILEAVFPPSEPTAMDGAIIAVVTIPGTPPYMIFLDGVFYGTTIEPLIVVEGIGSGEHTLQIFDQNGCSSNQLLVFVPFPGLNLSIGTGIIQGWAAGSTDAQQPATSVFTNAVTGTLQFPLGSRMHEITISHGIPSKRNQLKGETLSILSVDYFVDLVTTDFKKINFKIQSGIGIHPVPISSTPIHWNISAGMRTKIGKQIMFKCSMSFTGWGNFNAPFYKMNIQMPVLFHNKPGVLGKQRRVSGY